MADQPPPKRRAEQHRLVILGIPGILLGLGPAMIPLNFYAGIAISTTALLLLIYLFCHLFDSAETGKRWLGIIASIIGYGIILWIIWIPDSATLSILYDPADYPPGRLVAGIQWQNDFSALIIAMQNNGNNDLLGMDMYVFVDGAQVVQAGLIPGIDVCSGVPWAPVAPWVEVRIKANDGREFEIPFYRTKASSIYRLRCETLLAHSQVMVVLALANIGAKPAEKPRPNWVKVIYSLKAGYRPVNKHFNKCIVGDCPDIPTDVFAEFSRHQEAKATPSSNDAAPLLPDPF